jgi:N-methylhydantoinase A
MRGVIVPPHAGVFSALGLLLSPPRHDTSRSLPVGDQTFALISQAMEAVAATAASGLQEMGEATLDMVRLVDIRYRGQAHETSVPLEGVASWVELARLFHQIHAERNGFARPGDPIEVMTVRASALGRPALRWEDLPLTKPEGDPDRGRREVRFSDGSHEARVVWRPGLGPGDIVLGPAVIEEPQATTLVGPGERAAVHESGALEVSW